MKIKKVLGVMILYFKKTKMENKKYYEMSLRELEQEKKKMEETGNKQNYDLVCLLMQSEQELLSVTWNLHI